jgi:hypothetical protein
LIFYRKLSLQFRWSKTTGRYYDHKWDNHKKRKVTSHLQNCDVVIILIVDILFIILKRRRKSDCRRRLCRPYLYAWGKSKTNFLIACRLQVKRKKKNNPEFIPSAIAYMKSRDMRWNGNKEVDCFSFVTHIATGSASCDGSDYNLFDICLFCKVKTSVKYLSKNI